VVVGSKYSLHKFFDYLRTLPDHGHQIYLTTYMSNIRLIINSLFLLLSLKPHDHQFKHVLQAGFFLFNIRIVHQSTPYPTKPVTSIICYENIKDGIKYQKWIFYLSLYWIHVKILLVLYYKTDNLELG
jgi:hypothetical protein